MGFTEPTTFYILLKKEVRFAQQVGVAGTNLGMIVVVLKGGEKQ
jgi:hypothetical protein